MPKRRNDADSISSAHLTLTEMVAPFVPEGIDAGDPVSVRIPVSDADEKPVTSAAKKMKTYLIAAGLTLASLAGIAVAIVESEKSKTNSDASCKTNSDGALVFITGEGDVLHNVTYVNYPTGFLNQTQLVPIYTGGNPSNITTLGRLNCSELLCTTEANNFWLSSFMRTFYDDLCTKLAQRGENASSLCHGLQNFQNITVPSVCAEPSAPCATVVGEVVKAASTSACESAGASLPGYEAGSGSGSGSGAQSVGVIGFATRSSAGNSTSSCHEIVNNSVADNTTCFFYKKIEGLEYIPAQAENTPSVSSQP